jgi:hypothetical protein
MRLLNTAYLSIAVLCSAPVSIFANATTPTPAPTEIQVNKSGVVFSESTDTWPEKFKHTFRLGVDAYIAQGSEIDTESESLLRDLKLRANEECIRTLHYWVQQFKSSQIGTIRSEGCDDIVIYHSGSAAIGAMSQLEFSIVSNLENKNFIQQQVNFLQTFATEPANDQERFELKLRTQQLQAILKGNASQLLTIKEKITANSIQTEKLASAFEVDYSNSASIKNKKQAGAIITEYIPIALQKACKAYVAKIESKLSKRSQNDFQVFDPECSRLNNASYGSNFRISKTGPRSNLEWLYTELAAQGTDESEMGLLFSERFPEPHFSNQDIHLISTYQVRQNKFVHRGRFQGLVDLSHERLEVVLSLNTNEYGQAFQNYKARSNPDAEASLKKTLLSLCHIEAYRIEKALGVNWKLLNQCTLQTNSSSDVSGLLFSAFLVIELDKRLPNPTAKQKQALKKLEDQYYLRSHP